MFSFDFSFCRQFDVCVTRMGIYLPRGAACLQMQTCQRIDSNYATRASGLATPSAALMRSGSSVNATREGCEPLFAAVSRK